MPDDGGTRRRAVRCAVPESESRLKAAGQMTASSQFQLPNLRAHHRIGPGCNLPKNKYLDYSLPPVCH